MTSDLSTLARQAADHLRDGGLVAIPTETQYALAVRAADDAAVARCFALKQRPADDPQPIFLPSVAALDDVADGLSGGLRALAREVWPGALTLVLRRRPDWHSAAVPGDTVALRIPDHPTRARRPGRDPGADHGQLRERPRPPGCPQRRRRPPVLRRRRAHPAVGRPGASGPLRRLFSIAPVRSHACCARVRSPIADRSARRRAPRHHDHLIRRAPPGSRPPHEEAIRA